MLPLLQDTTCFLEYLALPQEHADANDVLYHIVILGKKTLPYIHPDVNVTSCVSGEPLAKER